MSRETDVVMLTGAEYDKLTDERDDLQKELAAERERREDAEAILRNVLNCCEQHWIALDVDDHFARYKD